MCYWNKWCLFVWLFLFVCHFRLLHIHRDLESTTAKRQRQDIKTSFTEREFLSQILLSHVWRAHRNADSEGRREGGFPKERWPRKQMDGSWSSFVWFWTCWGNFERIKRVLHGNLLSPGTKSTIYVLTQKTAKTGSNYEIVFMGAFLFSQSKSRSFIVQPIVSLETDVTKTRNGEWGMRLGLRFSRWIVNIDVHWRWNASLSYM